MTGDHGCYDHLMTISHFRNLAALGLLAGAVNGGVARQTLSAQALVSDVELWSVMLEQAVRETGRSAYILLDKTVASAQFRNSLRSRRPGSVLFDPLLQRNEVVARVTGLQLPSNVRLVDANLLLRSAREGQGVTVDFEVLKKEFPGSTLVQLSLPAFSQDGTKAVMYYWATGGFDDSWGTCYVFEKREGSWIIVDAPWSWIIRPRCVPTGDAPVLSGWEAYAARGVRVRE
jgi:hypothetical protein